MSDNKLYTKEDCQLLIENMTDKDDLRGQIVLFDGEKLKEELQQPDNQFCMVTGGSGCTLGYNDSSLLVTWMNDETEYRISDSYCLGVPKEEILPDWVKEKREKLAPLPIKNEEWLTKGRAIPHVDHNLFGEYRLLAEFDSVELIVCRNQRNPYQYDCPEADMESKQEPAKILFSVQVYQENVEEYRCLYQSADFETAKSEFARYADLVSEQTMVTPEEAKIIVKACATQLEQENYTDFQEEFLLHRIQGYLSGGVEKEEELDFEDEEDLEEDNDR